MKTSIVKDKSYTFALAIIKVSLGLIKKHNEFVLSRQLMKSGTSIGANIEEALGGHSRKDFLSKMTISYKEARETDYWLRLLKDSNLISENSFDILHNQLDELLKILSSIIKTTKNS